MLPDMMNVV
jgi:hypothetical protein